MASVFVSYANVDAGYVHALAAKLSEMGHGVSFAGDAVLPGTSWQAVLGAKLREADAVVIVVSAAAAASQWVMSEAGSALAYAQTRGRPIVLPVVLDGIEIPGPLKQVMCIVDPSRDEGHVAAQIHRALAAQVGRQIALDEAKEEQRQHLKNSAPEFISKLREDLTKRQTNDRASAERWYFAGYIALFLGVAVAIGRVFLFPTSDTGVMRTVEFLVLSLISVGLLVALSRYAFMLGKSYMAESLRSAERLHAISYGELYLNLFPDKLDWEEIKEAFEDWNIDRGSTFLTQDGKDYDPRLLETAVELAKVIADRSKKT